MGFFLFFLHVLYTISNVTNLCNFLFILFLQSDQLTKMIDLLFGNRLQFSLLLVLLGQLSEAGQRGVHVLDGQEAFAGSWE